MEIMEIVWLAAFVIFLALEAGTVGLVSIWFATGALAALITMWAGGSLWLQILLFLVTAVITLICVRPLVRKFITPRLVRTNVDGLVGMEAILSESVDNLRAEGAVVLRGVTWSARSTDGQPIDAGTTVRVDRIEGARVFVSPVSVNAQM